MKSQRIEWIDIARGLGILLVIYGHALTEQSLRYLIYSFHMPLFFFISGLVHHYKKNEHFKDTFKKSVVRNLVPYYKFALLTYIAVLILNNLTGLTFQRVTYQLFGILYASGNLAFLGFNVVLWFLPCLFVTKLGFFLLEKISNSKKFLTPTIFILSILGYLFATFLNPVKLPFGIEIALTGIVFFAAGYLVEEKREEISVFLKKYGLIILPVAIIGGLYIATQNYLTFEHQVDMRLNMYGNYFYFYIAALSGILSILIISIYIKKNRLLEFLGKNSLILFVWHWIVFIYLDKILELFLSPEYITSIHNTYLPPVYAIMAITLILITNKVISKFRLH